MHLLFYVSRLVLGTVSITPTCHVVCQTLSVRERREEICIRKNMYYIEEVTSQFSVTKPKSFFVTQ